MSALLESVDDPAFRKEHGWEMTSLSLGRLTVKYARRRQEDMPHSDMGGLHQRGTGHIHRLDVGLPKAHDDVVTDTINAWVQRHGSSEGSSNLEGHVRVLALSREAAAALKSSYGFAPNGNPVAFRSPDTNEVIVLLPYPDPTGLPARWEQRAPWVLNHELRHALQLLRIGDHLNKGSVILAEMDAMLAEWLEGGDKACEGYFEYMHDFRVGLPLGLQHPWQVIDAGYSCSPFFMHLHQRLPEFREKLWTDSICLERIKRSMSFHALDLSLNPRSSLDSEWIAFCSKLPIDQAQLKAQEQLMPLKRIQELHDGMAVLPSRVVDIEQWRKNGSQPMAFTVHATWSCSWFRFHGQGEVKVCAPSSPSGLGKQVFILASNSNQPCDAWDLMCEPCIIVDGERWIGLVGLGNMGASGLTVAGPIPVREVRMELD